jgi:hypothetical protein
MADDLDRLVARKAAMAAYVGFPVLYVIVLVRYPDYWAVATGIAFVLASGLLTSKIVLSLESPWAIIGLTPVFGGAWLGFLWLLFKLAG